LVIKEIEGLKHKFIISTIWNSFGVFVYFACQWLTTIFVVWLSYNGTSTGYDYINAGYLALAMSMTNFFHLVAQYNMRNFQVSDINTEYNDSEYAMSRLMTCVISILLCAFFVFVAGFSAIQRTIILCYMVFRLNEAFVDVLHGIAQKNWRMDYVGISLAVRGISMLVVFIVMLRFFDLLSAIVGMAVISWAVVLLFDVQKTRRLTRFSTFSIKKALTLLKRCFPLMIVLLCSVIIVSYSRYSIERIYSTADLGLYASVTTPAIIIQVGIAVFFAPLANLFTIYLKEGDRAKFIRVFAFVSALIIAVTVIFIVLFHFFGGWGLSILFEDSIVLYAHLLPGAAVIAGLTASLWFMNVVFSAIRDIKGLFFGNVAGVVICFSTADIFLTRYGLMGANYVIIVSMGAAVSCLLLRLLWCNKKKAEMFELPLNTAEV